MASAEAAGLLNNLSLDSKTKTPDTTEPITKTSVYQYPGNAPNVHIPVYDRPVTPVLPEYIDPAMCYAYPYYYGGYDVTATDWESYSKMMTADGVDMTTGVYHGYGYPPYSPYFPVASPTMGSDGQQLYQLQQYHYPQYSQPLTPNSAPYTPVSLAPKSTIPADQKPLIPVEAANLNSNVVANTGLVKGGSAVSVPPKSTYQSSFPANNSYRKVEFPGPMSAHAHKNPRIGLDSLSATNPWLNGSSEGSQRPVTNNAINSSFSKATNVPTSRKQDFRPNSQYLGLNHPGPLSNMGTPQGYTNNRMYPTKTYGQYGNNFRSNVGYGSNVYDSRTYGRGWSSFDAKSRARGRGYAYGNENVDSLGEITKGPRGYKPKPQKGLLPDIESVDGQDVQKSDEAVEESNDKISNITDKAKYNGEDFPAEYANAKFFIIKSYSEDDLHKSIKYNIWTSTTNGNQKLDAAYQEAQQISGGCPVFLFFSVNSSGQFAGLAEIVGPVDFEKSVEYWQLDNKWTGSFPVKWHIVKDIPNNSLRHITLEYNENKPVKLEDGLKVLNIFKEYSSKTSLLDDFEFYEGRHKSLQEKKAKQQQFQKQIWEGRATDEKSKVPNGATTPSADVTKIPENLVVGNGGNSVEVSEKLVENDVVVNAC
ncbi:hypothetical protein ACFE04_030793 [Oxalis oulophora]